jgi:hypothetical protein
MNQVYMEMADQNTILLSNRSGKDRRTKSGFNFRSLLFGGKRGKIRRQEDTSRIFYVDQFSPVLFFTIVSILFLCVLDALLTLFLLGQGTYEISPVMAYFLKFGPFVFFTSKYLMTITALICFLMFRNIAVRIIKIRTVSMLYLMAAFYLTVVLMQIYFVFTLPYSPELKLPPKVLTNSNIVCQMDIPNHHPIANIISSRV